MRTFPDGLDYEKQENWVSQGGEGVIDVFAIAPTFVFDPDKPVYTPIDDPEYVAGMQEFADIAINPVFDGLDVNIWYPKYRQVNGAHLLIADPVTRFFDGRPQLVLQDVFNAFEWFMAHRDPRRRFVIYSHSQGSIIQGFMLTQFLPVYLPKEQQALFGAGYLIGWGLNSAIADHTPFPPSISPTDTGTIISWNTCTRSELGKVRATWGDATTVAVNPITFDRTEDCIPADDNGQSVLGYFDEPTPRVQEHLTGARLVVPAELGGVFPGQLVLVDIDEHSFRDEASIAGQDESMLGYTHHWDISLFAGSIRANFVKRFGL
ncbi:MAG: DUF3089 domain-containing protein [Propionibacteriaceae bacterium]|jgi:hypothetical protein|nr:DUF3089 domain-containing protein [Propionibacteriaceae bacterium]